MKNGQRYLGIDRLQIAYCKLALSLDLDLNLDLNLSLTRRPR